MFEKTPSGRKAVLVLRDGTIFVGVGLGASKEVVGELVFNTSMTGFQEAVTDASYAGQVLIFSYPLVDNYGVNENAFESACAQVSGVAASEVCLRPRHHNSVKNFDEFLEEQGVPCITGIDTRAIVRRVRAQGVMPCVLKVCGEGEEVNEGGLLEKAREFDYGGIDFVERVSCRKRKEFIAEKEEKRVALIDYGVKESIIRELLARRISVILLPCKATARGVLREEIDGIVLSNGPGDPAVMSYAVETVRELLGRKPIFGICLGHQLLGLALEGKTFKLKFGHRGGNHGVKEVNGKRTFITSQNHGYAVKDLPKNVGEWFVNCLDGTNEGLKCDDLRVRSVQFHPEANPGPLDAKILFDEFKKELRG